MIPEYESKVAFRLSKSERTNIEKLVKERKFKSISCVIREALREFLSEGSGENATK
jgi:Arc/MetJ-type ribon-helix-helix transcriptional regulator